MTAFTRNLAPNNTTDDSFRTWGKQLSNDLTTIGLPKTNDAGQIDWATVSRPASGYAFSGYEMRTFSDSLQSVNPIYFKIRYGSANFDTNPRLDITFGNGSNGAGTLTGLLSSALYTSDYNNNYATATPQLCIFTGSPSRFAIALFANHTLGQFYCAERTKNAAGEDTAEGLLISAWTPQLRINQFIPALGTTLIVPSAQDVGFFTPDRGTSSADGTTISLYQNFFYRGGTLLNPAINALCYFDADVLAGSINPVSVYGKTSNYFFSGSNPQKTVARGGINNTCLAILYE